MASVISGNSVSLSNYVIKTVSDWFQCENSINLSLKMVYLLIFMLARYCVHDKKVSLCYKKGKYYGVMMYSSIKQIKIIYIKCECV